MAVFASRDDALQMEKGELNRAGAGLGWQGAVKVLPVPAVGLFSAVGTRVASVSR